MVPHGEFLEIYCRCDITVCEERDPKGLYKRARKGEIAEFTGISSPYDEPTAPELTIDTDRCSIEEGVIRVIALLSERGIV